MIYGEKNITRFTYNFATSTIVEFNLIYTIFFKLDIYIFIYFIYTSLLYSVGNRTNCIGQVMTF